MISIFSFVRQADLIEALSMALQYMILIESFYSLATPVVISLRELLLYMNRATEESRTPKGRPRINVEEEEEQLMFLIDANFRVKDIALIFGCSRRTIKRRLYELGIRSNDFTPLSDDELDHLVQNVVSVHPQSGEKTIVGQLRSHGIKIQRERIRQSLRRVDPTEIESQARRVLH